MEERTVEIRVEDGRGYEIQCIANVGVVNTSWAYGGGRGTYVLFAYELIKNCPRYWKVVLSGPKLNVSSASWLGAK